MGGGEDCAVEYRPRPRRKAADEVLMDDRTVSRRYRERESSFDRSNTKKSRRPAAITPDDQSESDDHTQSDDHKRSKVKASKSRRSSHSNDGGGQTHSTADPSSRGPSPSPLPQRRNGRDEDHSEERTAKGRRGGEADRKTRNGGTDKYAAPAGEERPRRRDTDRAGSDVRESVDRSRGGGDSRTHRRRDAPADDSEEERMRRRRPPRDREDRYYDDDDRRRRRERRHRRHSYSSSYSSDSDRSERRRRRRQRRQEREAAVGRGSDSKRVDGGGDVSDNRYMEGGGAPPANATVINTTSYQTASTGWGGGADYSNYNNGWGESTAPAAAPEYNSAWGNVQGGQDGWANTNAGQAYDSAWGGQGGANQSGKDFQTLLLPPPEWDGKKLITFARDFYIPHPAVDSMTQAKADSIRSEKGIKVITRYFDPQAEVPNPVITFELAGFPADITELLNKSFGAPTPIQVQGWPIALSGHNLLAIAQTGSGKTLGYILPAIVHANAQPKVEPGHGPIVLIMAPTRELAQQIEDSARPYLELNGLRSVALYGGLMDSNEKRRRLQVGVEFAIACPGKLMDFLDKRVLNLERVTYFVLDEADRMLDSGFSEHLSMIARQVRPHRQTLMWSATWPEEVQDIARTIFVGRPPIHISIGGEEARTVVSIKHSFTKVHSDQERWHVLTELIRDKVDVRVLIFTNTKRECNDIMRGIETEMPTLKANCIHGDRDQHARFEATREFARGTTNILIATEVVARGMDFPSVAMVINYRMPRRADEYIHRVGRTGRAGADGIAHSLFNYDEIYVLNSIKRVLMTTGSQMPEELEGDLYAGDGYGGGSAYGGAYGGGGKGYKRGYGGGGRDTGGWGDSGNNAWGNNEGGCDWNNPTSSTTTNNWNHDTANNGWGNNEGGCDWNNPTSSVSATNNWDNPPRSTTTTNAWDNDQNPDPKSADSHGPEVDSATKDRWVGDNWNNGFSENLASKLNCPSPLLEKLYGAPAPDVPAGDDDDSPPGTATNSPVYVRPSKRVSSPGMRDAN